jgi:lysophospholipase L1-like esterase
MCRYQNYLKRSHTTLSVVHSVCVSGITTAELKKIIKTATPSPPLNSVVVICIGTNDIIKNTPLGDLKNQFLSLLRLVRKKFSPKLLLILAIPQILRFLYNKVVLDKIDTFSSFLSTLQTDTTHIIRLPSSAHNLHQFFEHRYHPSRRPDGIHLNNFSFSCISQIIELEIKTLHQQYP